MQRATIGKTVFYHFMHKDDDQEPVLRWRPAIVVDVVPGEDNRLELAVLFSQLDHPAFPEPPRNVGALMGVEWRFDVPAVADGAVPEPGTWSWPH